MVRTFFLSFRLKNTYRVNSIIYSIKQLPLIKKILPDTLYQNHGLKIFGNVISALIEVGTTFIGKLLYLWLMIYSFISMYPTNSSETFLHLFFFLTLCGGLLNTYLFNPTRDKYYAMFLMNMDAREYTLSNYYYAMLKVFIGFLPFTILFGILTHIPIWLSILLPLFVVMVKTMINYFSLIDFKKTRKAKNENVPFKIVWILIVILLALAYLVPFTKIVMPTWLFVVLFMISLGLGSYCFFKIHRFTEYRMMYKQLFANSGMEKKTAEQINKETALKQIELDRDLTSSKDGFPYFHELFVKRHRKILTIAVKKQALVLLLLSVAIFIGVLVNKDIKSTTNGILLMWLPYFVFIMYMLNRGTTITQAMFMNCDHAMLTYRIYRNPNVILGLFRERLKTLISINLLPATIIGASLAFLLFLTGGTTNALNYVVLFVSIIAMSIFFSVHYLVMYYLLQPYNVNTEMKSSTYSIVQGVTYFACYYMMQLKLPTFYFGLVITLFCVVYSLLSLWIAYRMAPKTFKLRN